MDKYSIEILDSLPKEIDEKIHQGHDDHEASHGIVCDYKSFSVVIRNEAGEAIGVLSAYTAFAEICVDDIWVESDYRSLGLGRKLLGTLENRYKDKGYNNINLVTSQFQAVGFYEKCGYEIEFIRVNKHHPKLTKTFFVKYFDGESQTRGILDKRNRIQ